MPRATLQRIDWGKQESTERLLAAILAAQGMKIDYNRVAKLFGYGTTYSSIEGQLRKAKRIAATLPDDDNEKKSEEIMVTDGDETKDKKEARSGGDKVYPPVRKTSALKEKKEKETGEVKVAGKRAVGGRVTKKTGGATGSGRKKAGGARVEDEVEILEVVQLDA